MGAAPALLEREETILDSTSVLYVTLGDRSNIKIKKKYMRYGRRDNKPYFYSDDFGNAIEFVLNIGWICGWNSSKHVLPDFEQVMIEGRGFGRFQPYRKNPHFTFTIVSNKCRKRHGTSMKI